MTNSADPDQLTSSEANWSGSTLFANAGHIWVQQDQGSNNQFLFLLIVSFFNWSACILYIKGLDNHLVFLTLFQNWGNFHGLKFTFLSSLLSLSIKNVFSSHLIPVSFCLQLEVRMNSQLPDILIWSFWGLGCRDWPVLHTYGERMSFDKSPYWFKSKLKNMDRQISSNESKCTCAVWSRVISWHSVKSQGPVVQSVVSLTSSLRVILLTILVDSIHNILIFFAEKMWVAFALLQKLLTFFQQKISAYLHITRCKF